MTTLRAYPNTPAFDAMLADAARRADAQERSLPSDVRPPRRVSAVKSAKGVGA